MIARFKLWRKRSQAIAQLQAMSDRELADIGLSRGSIREAVYSE